jgi:hypothetical protein
LGQQSAWRGRPCRIDYGTAEWQRRFFDLIRGHISARYVMKPLQKPVAQHRGAGTKQRKCENRNADFQSEWKRSAFGMKRAEYLYQRGQKADAGAI